jgi:hypothetical protein
MAVEENGRNLATVAIKGRRCVESDKAPGILPRVGGDQNTRRVGEPVDYE